MSGTGTLARRLAALGKRKMQPEQALQRAVCRFLDVALIRGQALYFHPANGGLRSKAEAGIMTRLGVKPGVPDLCIIWSSAGQPAHVGFIELKSARGKPSPAQVAFGAACQAVQAPCEVARSLDDVQAILARWCVPVRLALSVRAA